MRYLLIAIIATLVYFQGIKPVIADRYFLMHKQGDKAALTQALAWSPNNTLIQIESGQLMRVLETTNGDVTTYSLWYLLGIQQLQAQNIQGGIGALQKCLWYYPDFAPAKDVMRQIQEAQAKK